MAEEEKDEQETTADAAAEGAADAPEQEAPEAPPEDAAEAAEPTPEPAAAADAEPAEQLGPKERRKRARAQHAGEPRPPRAPEERISERDAERRAKAKARSRYRSQQRAKKGEPKPGTPPAERVEGPKKQRQGIVTSARADKTITVQVESARRHPSYEKIVRRSKALHAHDEANEAGEGDTVRVVETRPMSKTKRWRLVEIVEKAR